jgi:two-component system nitrate/nitrite response regulator NarL
MIAEDHELVRKAFISLLNESRTAEVIDEACNGKELLHKLKLTLPDIVLMDYRMPVMDGREALQIIKAKNPEVRVIMMSVHDDNDLIMDFVAKGANGFISKSANPELLFTAILRTYKDGHYFDSKLSQLMANGILNKNNPEKLKKESLSDREISVLREICNGNTNKGISERLYISTSTVDFHKGNIYKKTNCKNVVDLVKYAFKHGIIHV